MPQPIFFTSVSHHSSTQKFAIKKNLSKMPVLSFSFDWDPLTLFLLGSWFSKICFLGGREVSLSVGSEIMNLEESFGWWAWAEMYRCNFLTCKCIFRWDSHLYLSFFPSVCLVCPSVACHISGIVHHVIIIFGTYV